MLWVDHLATRYHLTLGSSLSSYLDSGLSPSAGQWQHLAASFDGTTARFYVDGVEVASRTVSGGVGGSDSWRIGAYGSVPGGFFDGLIDEVRIYNRALTSTEIQADMSEPLGVADTTAPTKPANFVATATTQSSVTTQWSASTDDVAVLGYTLSLNGAAVATTAATTFTFTGLSCGTNHQFGVEAFDGSGNVSPKSLLTFAPPCGNPTGLVAAYSFDEGAGSVAGDSSGNGEVGTLAGATWAGGRYGGGLSFNGTNASVVLGSLGTFYQSGFTLEAWVQKQSAKSDVAIVGTWSSSGGPMIWIDHLATRYRLTLGSSFSGYLDSGVSPTAGAWQHLAATFDGGTARFYLDGVQVASAPYSGGVGSSNSWRVGAYGSSPGGFFDGLIDDVRIYDRALSAGEVQSDMNTPVAIAVAPSDTTPPTAPGPLTATVLPSKATLTWSAATDNVGVTRFNVHRSTVSGFVPTTANRIAQPTAASHVDSGVPAGVYYYKVTAEDAAGNVGDPSNEVSADVPPPDTTAPTVTITAPVAGPVAGPIVVTADASDQWGIRGVQFKLDGQNLGPEDTTAPYSATWDSRGELNGNHTLTAVARDTAENTATSAPVVANATNEGGAPAGIRASYAFDESGSSSAADSSGNAQTATLVGATRVSGKFGTAASLDGAAGYVDLPAFGTFYKTGFTLEAWVRKQSSKSDVAVLGTWTSGQGGGPMIWVDHVNAHYRLTLGNNFGNYLDSGRTPAIGQWQHVAATYDGTTVRFFVDGIETASAPFAGNTGSSSTWRIGAYGTSPTGFFDGLVDNVRVYDRALTPAEVAANRTSRIQLDTSRPTITARKPAPGAKNVGIASPVEATFSEPMLAPSFTASSFTLRDTSNNTLVPASVAYNPSTRVATLSPSVALNFGSVYRARVETSVRDLAGNPLASAVSWTFTTEASPPPVLVVGSTANPFGSYLGEILRSEGLTAFTTLDVAFLSPALLSKFDVVLLGEMPLSPAQVSALSGWVTAGGNLIAMRPDAQLAGLLGLTGGGTPLANAYLQVDTGTEPGSGIVGETLQIHGPADTYALSGATAIATLYSDASTATSSPAVTLHSVGSAGGQAAAFAFDLARSVVYTRQGNPAWASQDRDGAVGLRSSDMFYGGAQTDWVNTNKIAIPQADEQQRLLVNMVTTMERDRLPLPHFWYLPFMEKAAVVMSGDDHSPVQAEGGTVANFDVFKSMSPPGCVVVNWACVRASSYVYPNSALTPAQATAYAAEGFEVAVHVVVGNCPSTPISAAELTGQFATQLSDFEARYTGVPAPASNRTHCVYWPDWATNAKVELAQGIRMDANYYHYPGGWIGTSPGFMTGGGFPMRFADLDGTLIDVYQGHTHITDESTPDVAPFIASLLDNAVGPAGYYGAFGVNMHTDHPSPHGGAVEIVEAAQARSVPVISYKQLLDWTDGRNNSTIRGLSWNAGTLTFVTTIASGARGLRTLLPRRGPSGTLSGLTCGSSARAYTVQSIKGVEYAVFNSVSGTCSATYS